jgi:hypothetical protein
MERITQAVLAGVALMGLVACTDTVESQPPDATPQPAQVAAEAGAEPGEESEAFAEAEEEEVSALRSQEHWSSYVYYFEDFEGKRGHEWSRRRKGVTPSGRRFQGPHTTSDTTLKLKHLPKHDAITLSFDLYVIGSWGGSTAPDTWQVKLEDGPVLLRTSFSSVPHIYGPQAYPDWYPGNEFAGLTGSTERGTLGYPDVPGHDSVGDAVYRLTFTLPHDDDRVAFNFKRPSGGGDESWGLDNVKVTLWRKGGGPGASGADLAMKITADRSTVGPGEDVVYTVKVTNKGPGIATGVNLGTGISDHFNLTDVQCGAGTGTSYSCDLGTLEPGASVTSTFRVNVCCFGPGETRTPFFVAELASSSTDPNPSDNRVEVVTPIVGD